VTLLNSVSNRIGDGMIEARNLISGNRQEGIFLSASSLGNRIRGNFIGTAANGTSALGNGASGVALNGAAANSIGGAAAGEGNVISGNTNMGVWMTGVSASNNLVQGNFIGTDLNGLTAVKNVASGVQVESPANQIGGSGPGAGNVISGNGYIGVWLLNSNAVGNVVRGNLIGAAAGGTSGLGNAFGGIGLTDAANNEIGGLTVAERNLISANGFPANNGGVFIMGAKAKGNRFYGNFIGTDLNGQNALPNRFEGIYVVGASSNIIGSELVGGGNLISGNTTRGIRITNSVGGVIRGNLLGTRSDGTTSLANGQFNVELEDNSHAHQIGGLAPGAGNRVGFSGGGFAAIRVRDFSTNNAILGNAVFANSGLGIDIGTAGTNANDSCDNDLGANMLQNHPVLTQAYSGAKVGVRGTLNSAPNTTFRLQFFASPACDASGNGEGSVYLGDKLVNTGPACSTNFVATLPGAVVAGQVITATATDPANNTSEFSTCQPVLAAPRLNLSTVGSDQVSLTWLNTTPGFTLKETSDLSPPVNWTTVTNVPVVTSGKYEVTLVRPEGNRFYLLNFE
jgi:titin